MKTENDTELATPTALPPARGSTRIHVDETCPRCAIKPFAAPSCSTAPTRNERRAKLREEIWNYEHRKLSEMILDEDLNRDSVP